MPQTAADRLSQPEHPGPITDIKRGLAQSSSQQETATATAQPGCNPHQSYTSTEARLTRSAGMLRRPPPAGRPRGCLGLGGLASTAAGAEGWDSVSSPSWFRRLLVRMGGSPEGISLRLRYRGLALSLSWRIRGCLPCVRQQQPLVGMAMWGLHTG